jgi:transposase
LRGLERAYQIFFTQQAACPKSHSKPLNQSTQYWQFVFAGGSWVGFPKIGRKMVVLHQSWMGKMNIVTVLKTRPSRYFACTLVEDEVHEPARKPAAFGVDLGSKSFLVASNADEVAIPSPITCSKPENGYPTSAAPFPH